MTLLRLPLIALLLTAALSGAQPLPLSKSYWKDSGFLKSFNGSYQINARIEPSVTTKERGLLVSIQSLMASGKRKEALAKLKASSSIRTSPALSFNAGNIQFELGEFQKAATHYKNSIQLFPSFLRAHRNLGYVYAREDDWKKALPEFEQAIQLGDQDSSVYGQLAYGRMHQEQYASALQAYRLAQVTDPENIDWKAGIAQCLQHLQRNEEALALLDEVITARPTETSYYLLQSSIYLAMDRMDDAITNLDLVRRLGQLDAENYLLLANLYFRTETARLARPVMLAALAMEKKPAVSSALNLLEFAAHANEWPLAREFSEAIAKSWPDLKDATLSHRQQRLTALIDIDSGEHPARGAAILEKLIKSSPLDADSLLLLARYRASEERPQEAEMLLQQAARVEGHEYDAAIELAKLRVTTSRYHDALTQLDKALKITPSVSIQDYRNAIAHLVEAAE